MDFEWFDGFGGRDALLVIVALLLVYVVYAYLHYRRLHRHDEVGRAFNALLAQSAASAYADERDRASGAGSPAVDEPGLPPPVAGNDDFPWNEAPKTADAGQKIVALEVEVDQLRKEVGGLRAEVLLLREALKRAKERDNVPPSPEPAVAAQAVSPLYSDAMQLAIAGREAAAIAQECGISRAEAELVVALVRNRDTDPGQA